MTRRSAIFAALMVVAWAIGHPALAADQRTYDAAALAADRKAGKSIVVHVAAPWCSTCKAQKPILEKLAADPAFESFAIYELDFDTGGEALQALQVRNQSTLIVFKGETETGRSVGDTDADSIAALFKTAL
jgi:thiol-disulfide isomerase/thioredoxin